MNHSNRRHFLLSTASAAGAAALAARPSFAASTAERVRLGIIGLGGRGAQMLRVFTEMPTVEVAGLCDPDRSRLAAAAAEVPARIKSTDLRRLLDSPDIDAVSISTCNHWHCLAAIWAMQAGKHVLVEKPLGNTIWEGEQVVRASKRYDRLCQMNTQQRSDPMQAEIRQFLHEDRALGKILSVSVNRVAKRDSIGKRSKPLRPSADIDYDLWLGPARDLPVFRNRLHYDWHWVWNTGSGEMGNWGLHLIDDVRGNVFLDRVDQDIAVSSAGDRLVWNDAGETPNTHFAALETGAVPVTVSLCNLPVADTALFPPGPRTGYLVNCEAGQLHGQRGKAMATDTEGQVIRRFQGDPSNRRHAENFVQAILQNDRRLLTAPIEIGQESTTWCNLINISTRLERTERRPDSYDPSLRAEGPIADAIVQMNRLVGSATDGQTDSLLMGPRLRFDALQKCFLDESAAAANGLLHREDRRGFAVPRIV